MATARKKTPKKITRPATGGSAASLKRIMTGQVPLSRGGGRLTPSSSKKPQDRAR